MSLSSPLEDARIMVDDLIISQNDVWFSTVLGIEAPHFGEPKNRWLRFTRSDCWWSSINPNIIGAGRRGHFIVYRLGLLKIIDYQSIKIGI